MRHEQALPRARQVLAEVLRAPVEQVLSAPIDGYEPDAEFHASGHRFVIEYKGAASADLIGRAVSVLQTVRHERPDALPLLVVPFMGEVGKRLCEEQGMSWLDLSGNASIEGEDLLIRLEGRPNAYPRPGRPKSLFSPTYSRLARILLLRPDEEFTGSMLADETEMHRGTMSKLLRRYESAGFVSVSGTGRGARWSLTDPEMLLDAWREAYEFDDHAVRAGHIPGRAGEGLLRVIAQLCDESGLSYAATGLAAAWLIEPFATFRLVTVFTPAWPSDELLESIGFLDETRGANLWLVQPNDKGVFQGSGVTEDVCHVSSIQAYLDLKGQPERSREAAEQLGQRIRRDWNYGRG